MVSSLRRGWLVVVCGLKRKWGLHDFLFTSVRVYEASQLQCLGLTIIEKACVSRQAYSIYIYICVYLYTYICVSVCDLSPSKYFGPGSAHKNRSKFIFKKTTLVISIWIIRS